MIVRARASWARSLAVAMVAAAGRRSRQGRGRQRQAARAPLTVTSPGGGLTVTIGTDGVLTWSVAHRGRPLVRPSRIAMTLGDGRVLGRRRS